MAVEEARLHLIVPAEILLLMAIQGCRDKESPRKNRLKLAPASDEIPDGPDDEDKPISNKESSDGSGACFIHAIYPESSNPAREHW